jgi:chemotaxis protein CheC
MNPQLYTPDQNDALQEVVNIAMGQAGSSLAQILDHFVQLSVPRIRMVTVANVMTTVVELLGHNVEVAAVRQAFYNDLRGEALVIFPHPGLRDIAELMDYTELDTQSTQELLLDIGNVLVGAILNGIADILAMDLSFTAPALMAERTYVDRMLMPNELSWTHALLLEVKFALEQRDFKCHLLMFLAEETINSLATVLDAFISSI